MTPKHYARQNLKEECVSAAGWASVSVPWETRVPGVEEAAQATLLRDIFDPFRSTRLAEAPMTFSIAMTAEDIYERRSFEQLPELAEALADAGCTDAELLGHLQGPGPHVRGCWALDLVLAKT